MHIYQSIRINLKKVLNERNQVHEQYVRYDNIHASYIYYPFTKKPGKLFKRKLNFKKTITILSSTSLSL